MRSREIIGFTQADINKAVERGWTVMYPEDPVGKAWLDTLTPEQRRQYMGYVSAEREYKQTLWRKVDAYDDIWEDQLRKTRTDPSMAPGKHWYWDGIKREWQPHWGAMLDERGTMIDDDIAEWRKTNKPPDFRTSYEKIKYNLRSYAKSKIGKFVPEVTHYIPKVVGGADAVFTGISIVTGKQIGRAHV